MLSALLLAGLARRGRAAAGAYAREYSYVSDDFFSAWDFISAPDPTHGTVDYVGEAEAVAAGLVRATADRVYMGVDMEAVLPMGSGRRAVRVESRTSYSEGLFVLAVEHAPTGCGAWPAFWMYGEDASHPWPTWGEFDIIEGVHTATRVMTTLHTSQDCRQDEVSPADPAVEWATGRRGNPTTDCYVSAPSQWPNQGCTQQGPDATMGAGFNAAGGGTYAAEWDPEAGHIRTWFWPSGSEPPDLLRRQPDPESWGPAYSYFRLGLGNCNPAHFQRMRLVFDITFCGDMGDPTWAASCPDKAVQGLSCQDFVRLHPEEMTEAYWSISALDVYLRGDPAAEPPPPREPPPEEWPKWIFLLGCIGALAAVAALYALVWVKVRKDAGESNRLTALFDKYQHLLTGAASSLPSGPWSWLIPAQLGTNSWARLALDDKDHKGEERSANQYPAGPPAHSLGGGLGVALPLAGLRSGNRGEVNGGRWQSFTAPQTPRVADLP